MFSKISELKNLLLSRKFFFGGSFLVGFISGYFLGLIKAHLFILSALSDAPNIFSWINFSWLKKLVQVAPNPTFLSDVAAFEAAIIAFLVPLSIEIISKISERYSSDVITRSFSNDWKNLLLPPFLLINIFLAILLRFFVQDDVNSLAWKISAWLMLAALLFIAFVIWRVIVDIKTIMSDTRSVLNKLYDDVKNSLE